MTARRYLTAEEAADLLGVQVPTLYAYVSRGLIRSEPVGGVSRSHRYREEDIAALLARRETRRNPTEAASQALHFGAPVLDSAITLIQDGRLYYRGYDALELAANHPFEAVVALLWTGGLEAKAVFGTAEDRPLRCLAKMGLPELELLRPVEAFQALLPLAAADDAAAFDLSPPHVVQTGVAIYQEMLGMLTGRPLVGSMAEALQQALAPNTPQACCLFDAALILCADHELNVSAFTARCIASAGATPYDVVIGALSALRGFRHGGHTERVEALLEELELAGPGADPLAAVRGRLRRGEGMPGFGQALYPEGDPRARYLLRLTAELFPQHPALLQSQALAAAVESAIRLRPTIDFALVVLSRVLGLRPGMALALFALGRTAGWLGHALEQYGRSEVIRPRARYSGPVVEGGRGSSGQ